jgi:Holliday junction resolvase-like predicted endonuclease
LPLYPEIFYMASTFQKGKWGETLALNWLTQHDLPENTVSGLKRKKIASAAAAFTESKDYQGDIRFDIIGIVYDGHHNPEIRHFPDAFFPGLF